MFVVKDEETMLIAWLICFSNLFAINIMARSFQIQVDINNQNTTYAIDTVERFFEGEINLTRTIGTETVLMLQRERFRGDTEVAYGLARTMSSRSRNVNLFGNNHLQTAEIKQWVKLAVNSIPNPKKFNSSLHEVEEALVSRRYLSDMVHAVTIADIAVWAEYKRSPLWKSLEDRKSTFNSTFHWFGRLSALPQFQPAK